MSRDQSKMSRDQSTIKLRKQWIKQWTKLNSYQFSQYHIFASFQWSEGMLAISIVIDYFKTRVAFRRVGSLSLIG